MIDSEYSQIILCRRLSNDELLCLLIYIHLHKNVGRGEKKPKSVYEERPKITTPKPLELFGPYCTQPEKTRYDENRTYTQCR
jgi:hypothetical protein